jgi:hypothetical protein
MRELLTLTILLTQAELVGCFYVIQIVGDCNCAAGNNLITLFLPTFTNTGHIQQVLSICKFVSYSALWHTQT